MPASDAQRSPQCPACGHPLRPLSHAGVGLDVCLECRGIWLDAGELERLLGSHASIPLEAAAPQAAVHGQRGCPKRHGPMQALTAGRGVLIDRCQTCSGLWLDRGEIGRLQRLAPGADRVARRAADLDLRVAEAQRAADDERAADQQETAEPQRTEWLFQFLTDLPREVYSPTRARPLATYGLIAANFLAFFAQVWAMSLAAIPIPEEQLFNQFGLVPNAFVHGTAMWTIFTSMFMHGDAWHLAGNMYFLVVFGDNVEDRLGVGQYLGLYLLGGVGAALAHVATDPASTIPVIGASGAVSAVLGAYVFFFPDRRLYMMILYSLRRVRAIWYLGLWLALQFAFAAAGAPGVAWWAHIGGFGVGVAAAAGHRALVRRRLATVAAG